MRVIIAFRYSCNYLAVIVWLMISGVLITSGNSRALVKSSNSRQLISNQSGQAKPAIQVAADSITSFGLEFYRYLTSEKDDNLVFSPYSLSVVMGMAYQGARGTTADEIRKVFKFPASSQVMETGFRDLLARIKSQDGLRVANALWLQKGYSFLDDFLKKAESYYEGHTFYCDFLSQPEDSIELINNWVRENTFGRIPVILSEHSVGPLTRLILTGAIYFKGEWVHYFEEGFTKEENFWVDSENAVKVPMMRISGANLRYTENDKLQALELPYQWNSISMVVLLPRRDLGSLEDQLDLQKWQQINDRLKEELVMVYLPRFKFEKVYLLGGPEGYLARLGMPTVFSARADFSAMARTQEPLFVNDVIQKAMIEVDERGTEAAAATATGVLGGVVGEVKTPKPKVFRADHSFIFLIQEKRTGAILFFGRVMDPTK